MSFGSRNSLHEELNRLLLKRLGPRFASAFTRPSIIGAEMAWSTDLRGDIVPAARIVKSGKDAFVAECLNAGKTLAALALELAGAGVNTRLGNLAQILNAALTVPGPEFLLAVDDMPVLVFWGFSRGDGTICQPFSAAPLVLPKAALVRPVAKTPTIRPPEPKRRPRRGALIFFLILAAACLVLLLRCQSSVPLLESNAIFGSTQWMSAALQGNVFFIPPGTGQLPDFDRLKPVGTVHARTLDISPRSFLAGFPGVTDRFEWFALRYTGQIHVATTGQYMFRIISDDGAKLYIDDGLVIDNDGVHGAAARPSELALQAGEHSLRLEYFQGVRTGTALQLHSGALGAELHVFPDCWLSLRTPEAAGIHWVFWTVDFWRRLF